MRPDAHANGRRIFSAGRRGVPIGWLITGAAVWFTATSMPLVWRAAWATEALHERAGAGTLVAFTAAVFAFNAILLGLIVNRWTVRMVLPALLVLHAGASYFAWAYGVVIDTSMMRNVLVTDMREAREYLVPGLWVTLLTIGLVPAIAVMRLPLRRAPLAEAISVRTLWLLGAICLLLLALVTGFDGMASLMRGHKHVRYLISPANVLVSTVRALSEIRRGGPRVPISHRVSQVPHLPGARPHVLVLVVGETVRAQNWGLNGYARQTTPELAGRSVINFRDVTACGSSTEVSLPCMFSMQGRRDYDSDEIARSESLLHVLVRAGVGVMWRDNQTGCKGVCEGVAFESFRDARVPGFCTAEGCRDEILLNGLEARLRAIRTDTVIVLHPLGNHGPAYFRRYPAELRRFRPDCRTPELSRCSREEIVNAYDNAVLATDRLLARTIDLLSSMTQVDAAMIFVSDHGESLGENGLYLHGIPYPIAPDAQLKVPMVMWFSPGMQASRGVDMRCLEARAARPAEHDNLFHTVLGVLEVRAEPYRASLDLLDGCARRVSVRPARAAPSTHSPATRPSVRSTAS
jgi:lipid A ethanolaminephosphotransferase